MQSAFCIAQVRILHFTATSGYDHQTRAASYNMLQQLGTQYNFITDNDSTGFAFNSLANLNQYNAIVFANTSGDSILNALQRINFEQYIAGGGNLIGIHSATDTYRHSTANGNNTGIWDFYPELLGASVQQNPTHVNGTPVFTMYSQQSYFLLNDLPSTWQKAEEYYYWQNGYFDTLHNSTLLLVDTTVGPNGMINSYDAPRPAAWYKITSFGNRIFYTSLGHEITNYSSDTLFIKLIRNAVLWATGISNSISSSTAIIETFKVFPNPFSENVNVKLNYMTNVESCKVEIYNTMQRKVYVGKIRPGVNYTIDTKSLSDGVYLICISGLDFNANKIIVKNGRLK